MENDDPPGTADVHDHVRTELVLFVRELRLAGASVPANAATTAGRALREVGLADRARTQTALRSSLLTTHEDYETFDRAFETFWTRLRATLDTSQPSLPLADDRDGALGYQVDARRDRGAPRRGENDRADAELAPLESFAATGPNGGDDDRDAATAAAYSPYGNRGEVDDSPLEGGDLGSAVRDITRSLAEIRGPQFQPGVDEPDVRRAIRTSLNTGGTVLSLPYRERRRTTVRALVLVDVSQSILDAIDRGFLIDFLREVRARWRRTRVFFFDEDIQEVTEAIDAPSATAAIEALESAETVWGGGTRIGESLATLHETTPDAVDRRTAVFVVSDGLELGDVSVLERELSWLARRARWVFWLNPLATAAEYEPTARGMAAALPYVDGLFAFATRDDVVEMATQLQRQGPGGRIGHELDSGRRD